MILAKYKKTLQYGESNTPLTQQSTERQTYRQARKAVVLVAPSSYSDE